MKNIIVIIPAYNEQERIGEACQSLAKLKDEYKSRDLNFQIFVINDGSIDKTGEIAERSGADKVVHHTINKGLGAAIRTGLKAAHEAKANIVVKFDADLQHNPNDIKRLIEPILKEEVDVVYGHRFNNIQYKMPFVRKVGNLVFTGLMRWLTGWPVYDSQPGILAVNKAYLEVFYLPGNYNYTQQILLDSYHRGMRFAHVDVEFKKRETGKSFISYKYPFKVIPQIVNIIIGVKPLKFFGPIAFFFLALAFLIFFYDLSFWIVGKNLRPVAHSNFVLGTSIFGIQTLFFGMLADLIVNQNRYRK